MYLLALKADLQESLLTDAETHAYDAVQEHGTQEQNLTYKSRSDLLRYSVFRYMPPYEPLALSWITGDILAASDILDSQSCMSIMPIRSPGDYILLLTCTKMRYVNQFEKFQPLGTCLAE